ncbi:unnamed protein product [Blepharisma stoltei]|uniref:Ycf15 n=1 Tax=Blepharisma stoltei TaxID=1481888 RepID=A0AAU9IW38_9CILI|nr:unnamed protein product [Blepharisma stoltei]
MELQEAQRSPEAILNSQVNNNANRKSIKILILNIGSKIKQTIFGRKSEPESIEENGEVQWDNGIENIMYDDSEMWFEPLPVRF